MRNIFITEERGQWVVTLQLSGGRRQRYSCDTLPLARRWVVLLGGPVRRYEPRLNQAQPAA